MSGERHHPREKRSHGEDYPGGAEDAKSPEEQYDAPATPGENGAPGRDAKRAQEPKAPASRRKG